MDRAEDGNGFIRITLRDVYDSVEDVKRDVALLVVASQNAGTLSKDHEDRLRSVERRVLALPSIATLIAIASLVLAVLSFQQRNASQASVSAPRTVRTTTTIAESREPLASNKTAEAASPVRAGSANEGLQAPAASAPTTPTTVRVATTPTTKRSAPITTTTARSSLLDSILRSLATVPTSP